MTSDPKEALERLKRLASQTSADQTARDVFTLIAEREGLEREVERLTIENDQQSFALTEAEEGQTRALDGWGDATSRAKAAEAKLSALKTSLRETLSYAGEGIQAAGCGFTGWEACEKRAAALLHPTVPVESDFVDQDAADAQSMSADALEKALAAVPVQDVAGLLRRVMMVVDGPTPHRDVAQLDIRAHPIFDDVRAAFHLVPPSQGEGVLDIAHHHNIHPWAQPGDRPDRWWRLRFDDQDMREMVWSGPNAERDARAAYAQYCPAWNCYLFATVEARAQPHPDVSVLVEALKEMRAYANEAVSAAGCGFTGWVAAEMRAAQALAAFRSHQEERM